MLQCVAVCCSVLQCTTSISLLAKRLVCVYATGQLLYCIVLQCVAGFFRVLQGVAVCCSELILKGLCFWCATE